MYYRADTSESTGNSLSELPSYFDVQEDWQRNNDELIIQIRRAKNIKKYYKKYINNKRTNNRNKKN